LLFRPNGGEYWETGSVQEIQFGYFQDSASPIIMLEVSYSLDGGASYPHYVGNPGVGMSSFDWTVPADTSATAMMQLAVSDEAGNVGYDASDAVFAMGPYSSVSVPTSPIANASLYQNVPNPFGSSTILRYDIPDGGSEVCLNVYSVNGRLVRNMVAEYQSGGYKEVTWDGRDNQGNQVPSGVYFYQLVASEYLATKRMLLLR
jgi:hypothetical protein